MIITPFTRKIVFKADQTIVPKVEELLKSWCGAIPGKSGFLMEKMYTTLFPLNANRAYAFDVTWNQPLGVLFSNWASDTNSFWIYIQNDEDLADFDAVLRLNVKSYLKMVPPELAQSIKEQMAKGGYTLLEAN
jgi:hypothetical protein